MPCPTFFFAARISESNAAAAMAAATADRPQAHAAGSDVDPDRPDRMRRTGRGAAVNALNTGKDVRLTAVADLFDFQANEPIEAAREGEARPSRRSAGTLFRRLRRLQAADRLGRRRGADRGDRAFSSDVARPRPSTRASTSSLRRPTPSTLPASGKPSPPVKRPRRTAKPRLGALLAIQSAPCGRP